MPYLLGIDVGTTTCRCALFDLDGNEIAASYRESTTDFPRPLWAQIHPDHWWDLVRVVAREVVAQAPGPIAGLGLSGLMHAPVVLDADGRPVAPAQLWMDQRSAKQAAAITRELARGDGGRAIHTTVSASKLRWLSEEEPAAFARARHLMLPKDYVRYRLTGVVGTDRSDASGTGLWDRERGEWDWAAIEASRVPRALIPEARNAWESGGQVSEQAAAETGIPAGTPVAMGGADTLCTRIAAGPLAVGDACTYMGTATWIGVVGGHAADGSPIFRFGGATATTGAALRWVRDVFGASGDERAPSASYEALLEGVAEISPGADGLICLPHLMGERGPTPEPRARAAMIGLTLLHRRRHITRAVLEGTALQIRRLYDDRANGEVRCSVVGGGAARSDLWMQILADVTGVPVRTPRIVETSVLGAAMLGGVAAGLFSLDEAARRMVHPGRSFQPDETAHAVYNAIYRRYCELDAFLMPRYREEE
ncbi:MAG: hypothetical protein EPO26_13510 [Chloroflexota bacterium]|nr:MAG: hypothetical protein EPO26_13510 [Chloroflexota bacterium]